MPVVTKQEFARMVGRTPSAVSNWIAQGRLRTALVGSGTRAKIDVEKAMAELGQNLHVGQQLARISHRLGDGGRL